MNTRVPIGDLPLLLSVYLHSMTENGLELGGFSTRKVQRKSPSPSHPRSSTVIVRVSGPLIALSSSPLQTKNRP